MYAEIEVKIERSFTVRVPVGRLSHECEIPMERLLAPEGTWGPGDHEEVEAWAIEQCDDLTPHLVFEEYDWSEVTRFKLKEETK